MHSKTKNAEKPESSAERLVQVVKRIEEDIVLGRLHPRERLVEEVLAERFQTSRYIIREAFAELERMRAIVRVKNRGVVVTAYTPEEVENLYYMRELLETSAAKIIPFPLNQETFNQLSEIQARHSAEVSTGNIRATFRIDIEFHRTLFAASNNRFLSEAINQFAQSAHVIRAYSVVNPVFLNRSKVEHEAMLEAIRIGDRNRLVELCRVHIMPSKEAYIASYLRRFPETDFQKITSI